MDLKPKILFIPLLFSCTTGVYSQTIATDTVTDVGPDASQLGEVVVKATRALKTEKATVDALKTSLSVASAVSGELIRQSADKDASEIMKRITGVTVMNDKFIVARGLSQRYNNVWVNGVSMPSSEPDTRSFSFDLIPSGQIENIMLFKSPSPDLPADFSGGFIKLITRNTPEYPPLNISFTIGYNTETTFRNMHYNPGGCTGWLKFDNDWRIKTRKAIPDMKFSASYGKNWWLSSGDKITLNTAINYSYSSLRYADMENARYGRYNIAEDRPEYLYDYTDNRYQTSSRWGAMLNLSWDHGSSKFHFRNIFNRISQDRLTERTGWQNISSRYDQEKTEYLYNSRNTYVGQLAGTTDFSNGGISWTAAYTYADRNQPDRRIINRQQNDLYGDTHFGEMQIEQNSIERDFTKLHEHNISIGSDYHLDFKLAGQEQTFKAGIFGQYRTRDYRQRAFFYRFNADNLPDDFSYRDVIDEILIPANYGDDKLYLHDGTDNRDSYSGHEWQGHAYAAYTLPKGTYTLKGWVYVTEGSELTIEPGTVIKGEKETEAALIVEPGGKLWAQGTATEPIVFTSAQPAGKRRPGDWGGLIICGRARNNQGVMAIEGGPRTTHGGNDDNDCSGAISYVRVEFAGYPFAPDQEINGITFGSVGRATKIDHLQVSYSNDDSYEWFGGCSDAKYLVAYHGWDDDFDTDNGFSGRVQFCLGVRNPRLADQSVSNGFESDNCADAATKSPFTSCVFSNVTFVGPMTDPSFVNTSDYINGGGLNPGNGSRLGQFQAAMQVRRNSHLSCFNSVAMGYPVGLIIENDKGAATQQAATEGTLKLNNIYFAGMGILGSDKNKSFVDGLCVNGSDIDKTKESFSSSYFKSAPGNKVFASIADLTLSSDYKPLAGSPLLSAASFADTLLSAGFVKVNYIGAFSGLSDSWANGWTNFNPQYTNY